VRSSIEATEWVIAAVRNDYNLSPSRYVSVDGEQEVLPLEEAVVLLEEAEEEREEEEDKELWEVLSNLGLIRS
jgi:type I restriction enzyme M protein